MPSSGITPIGQGWTNARGLRGLGGPKPVPNFFVYFNISSVRCQPSIQLIFFVNVLRPSTMAQDRLDGLSLLAIERDAAQKLDIDIIRQVCKH